MKTGEWVRKAVHEEKIIVMDRKRPIAKLVPFTVKDEFTPFANRPLAKGFAALPKSRHDSTRYLSEERDRS